MLAGEVLEFLKRLQRDAILPIPEVTVGTGVGPPLRNLKMRESFCSRPNDADGTQKKE